MSVVQETADRWVAKIEALLTARGIDTQTFAVKADQRVLLLNWKVWTLRYGVPLDWILGTALLRYQKYRPIPRHGEKPRFGIPIAPVTGPGFQEYLERQIPEAFGGTDPAAIAQANLRSRMLGGEEPEADPAPLPLPEALSQYRKRVLNLQSKAATASKRYRRPWRGNPWL